MRACVRVCVISGVAFIEGKNYPCGSDIYLLITHLISSEGNKPFSNISCGSTWTVYYTYALLVEETGYKNKVEIIITSSW